ncbi:MAG: flagellar basal-body protein FlbY, partial [Asticcacaulis sp.]
MAITAHNPSERARQLLALTQRLGERLRLETEILEAHRAQDLFDGIEETRQLSNIYRHESARIKADPSLLA